jgi:metal-sulfur cluster biosynthetic enzyme
MNGGPKENANPTVLRVEKVARRRQPLGWSAVQSLSTNVVSSAATSNGTDRAIRLALRDADQHCAKTEQESSLGKSTAYFPAELGRRKFRPGATIATADHQQSNKPAPRDAIDVDEIFEIIRNIQDPEHPLTLEQLGVVSRNQIEVEDNPPDEISKLDIRFTPTIPHCSMATMIGLCIRVKLLRSLPSSGRFKVTVRIEPGTHNSENSVNKQLADKERVCAALENKHLLGVVNKCIRQGMANSHHVHSESCLH